MRKHSGRAPSEHSDRKVKIFERQLLPIVRRLRQREWPTAAVQAPVENRAGDVERRESDAEVVSRSSRLALSRLLLLLLAARRRLAAEMMIARARCKFTVLASEEGLYRLLDARSLNSWLDISSGLASAKPLVSHAKPVEYSNWNTVTAKPVEYSN